MLIDQSSKCENLDLLRTEESDHCERVEGSDRCPISATPLLAWSLSGAQWTQRSRQRHWPDGAAEAASEAFEASYALSAKLGNPLLLAYATSKLGLLADAEERFGDALRRHIEANELFESVGDPGGTGYALSRASLSAYGLGDYSEALRLARAGYEAFSESSHRWGLTGRSAASVLRHSRWETAPRHANGLTSRSSARTPQRPSRSSFLP